MSFLFFAQWKFISTSPADITLIYRCSTWAEALFYTIVNLSRIPNEFRNLTSAAKDLKLFSWAYLTHNLNILWRKMEKKLKLTLRVLEEGIYKFEDLFNYKFNWTVVRRVQVSIKRFCGALQISSATIFLLIHVKFH